MDATTQVLCSCTLTFGVPIVIAAWELWTLRPAARYLPPADEPSPEPTPLPGPGASPRIQKPLPDCLVPKAAPSRVSELA